MGDAANQVTHEAEEQCREHRRNTGGNSCAEEHCVQCHDLGGVRSEHVVDEEVRQNQDRERHGPRHAADAVGGLLANPVHNLERLEVVGHAHEHGEEDEGGPGAGVLRHVLPGQNLGHQQNTDAKEGCTGGVNAQGGTGHPQDQQQHEGAEHNPFLHAHGAHFVQFLARVLGCVGGLLDGRRVNLRHDPRQRNQRGQAGNDSRQSPGTPVEVDAAVVRELLRQRVTRHCGQEHGRGDGVNLRLGHEQVGTELTARLGGLVRGAVDLGEGTDNRVNHATGTRCVGGGGGGEHQVGDGHAVGQAEGGFTECTHEEQRDALTQTRNEEAVGDEEGGHDNPDGGVAEAGQRLILSRHGAGNHCGTQAHERHGRGGQRLENQAENGADEDGEHVHAARVDTFGGGHEPEGEGDGYDDGNLHDKFRALGLRRLHLLSGCGGGRRCVGGGGLCHGPISFAKRTGWRARGVVLTGRGVRFFCVVMLCLCARCGSVGHRTIAPFNLSVRGCHAEGVRRRI